MLELKSFNTFAKENLGERLEQSTKNILVELERNQKAIRSEYLRKFDELFQHCIQLQNAGMKKEAAFVHIFYLKSSLYMDKLELQFQVFDKMSYLDKTECMELWRPDIFENFFWKDLKWFEHIAVQQMIGFGYPQMMEMKQKYFTLYVGMIGQFFIKEAGEITTLPSYEVMKKEENIQVIFGGFMDMGIQIWPQLEVKVDYKQEV